MGSGGDAGAFIKVYFKLWLNRLGGCYICVAFAETKVIYFKVSGFGQQDWSVDVATDLATIMENLPQIIYAFSNEQYPCNLNFYEQGIERYLTFEKEDFLKVTCQSLNSWIPSPDCIYLSEKTILSQLVELNSVFIQLAKIVCPHLSKSELFVNWSKNLNSPD